MTEQADSSPSSSRQPQTRRALPRRIIAVILLTVCLLWPMWSHRQFHTYLMVAQSSPSDAMVNWERLEKRFEPIQGVLPAGTVFEYSVTQEVNVASSRANDVQFILAPLIMQRNPSAGSVEYVIADKRNNAELARYIQQESLEVVMAFGQGLAILRRPVPQGENQ